MMLLLQEEEEEEEGLHIGPCREENRTNVGRNWMSPYVASTFPGFTTTSILYLEPVSSLMVLVWPNRVPSTLKNTGPSLGWIRREIKMLMSSGTSSIVPGFVVSGVNRRSGGCGDAEERAGSSWTERRFRLSFTIKAEWSEPELRFSLNCRG